MAALARLWNQALERRPMALGLCAAVVVLGVLLIAIGEVLEWGWTRLIGAGAISTGAVLFGVLLGWSDPLRPRVASVLRSWRRGIVLILTAIMILPLFIGLLLSFGGLIFGGADGNWYLLLLGILFVVLMLGISAATVAAALALALQGLDETGGTTSTRSNGRDAS
jgi:hypothetical protein